MPHCGENILFTHGLHEVSLPEHLHENRFWRREPNSDPLLTVVLGYLKFGRVLVDGKNGFSAVIAKYCQAHLPF